MLTAFKINNLSAKNMINKKYLGGTSLMLDEIFNSVSPEDKQAMRKIFENVTDEQMQKYKDEVSADLFPYIKASPEQRNANDKWNEPTYRLKLIYFAFLSVQRGYLLMTRLAVIPKKTSNGDAYRTVTAVFSSLMNTVCFSKLSDSIFDEKQSYKDYN